MVQPVLGSMIECALPTPEMMPADNAERKVAAKPNVLRQSPVNMYSNIT
jgi:hypothetical protein